MLPADPTIAEWVAAGVAAGLVAVVAAGHLLRRSLVRSPASGWGRAAALLLGTVTAGVLLALAVVIAAGMRAERIDLAAGTGYPEGPLAGVLLADDVATAGHVAVYASALLLPLAATLGVLAVAVAVTPERAALRIAAGGGCAVGVAVCIMLLAFDTGSIVAGVAAAGLLLSVAAGMCLTIDAAMPRGAPHT